MILIKKGISTVVSIIIACLTLFFTKYVNNIITKKIFIANTLYLK